MWETEWMPLESADKESLRGMGRRFQWMTLVRYAALTLGLGSLTPWS